MSSASAAQNSQKKVSHSNESDSHSEHSSILSASDPYGPEIRPYHVYEANAKYRANLKFPPSSQDTWAQNYFAYPESSDLETTYDASSCAPHPTRSKPVSYFKNEHLRMSSNNSDAMFSYLSSPSASIATQDNISYQITNSSKSELEINPPDMDQPLYEPETRRVNTTGTARRYPSVRRSHLRRKRPPQSISSHEDSIRGRGVLATIESEDESLYNKTALKRTNAIKSKVGWLTRLRNLGLQIKNKFKKNWRYIAQKKSFKFMRSKKNGTNKKAISLPLERETAQDISELKREINYWYTTKDTKYIAVDSSPNARYKLVDTPPSHSPDSLPLAQKISPPPVPEHRVASNPIMQKEIDKRKKSNRISAFSNYDPKKQLEMVSITDVRTTSDNKTFTATPESFTRKPQSVIEIEEASEDDASEQHEVTFVDYPKQISKDPAPDLETDEGDDEDADEIEHEAEDSGSFDPEEEDEQVNEVLLKMAYKYWTAYLRKAVTNRIQTKLDMRRLSMIQEPDEAEKYAENVFGLMSDSDSITDVDSISTANTSITDAATEISILTQSDMAFSYVSSTFNPTPIPPVPSDILRYQQQYMDRFKNKLSDANVKRASSDPSLKPRMNVKPNLAVPVNAKTQSRFMTNLIT